MVAFTAKMQHNSGTITKLMLTRYNTFQYGKKLIRGVIAVGLIVYGVYGDPTLFMPMVCLILGCVMIANLNLAPRLLARRLVKQMDGAFPSSDYAFGEDGFTFHAKGEPVAYKQLIRLVEDRQYLYLYVSEDSAYMVDKATVAGGDVGELKAFIAAKAGQKWTRPNSLLTLRFRSLFSRKKS